MKAILPIIMLFITINLNAQNIFTRYYGTPNDIIWAHSFIQTQEGDYVICGMQWNNFTTYSMGFLLKVNPQGDQIWKKTFTDPGNTGWRTFDDIAVTSNNRYITVGSDTRPNSVFPFSIHEDYFILTDTSGQVIFDTSHYGSAVTVANSLVLLPNNDFVITGGAANINHMDDVSLIKYDTSGNQLWSKNHGVPGAHDFATKVCSTPDGGFIISALTENPGWGPRKVYLVKTDGNGDSLWARVFNNPDEDCWHCDICTTPDGDFLLIYTAINVITQEPYSTFCKLNSLGDVVWAKSFNTQWSTYLSKSVITPVGNYLFAGALDSSTLSIKTDPAGNLMWVKTLHLGDHYEIAKIEFTPDHHIVMLGFNPDTAYPHYQDIVLIKTDSLASNFSDINSIIINDIREESSNTGMVSIIPNPFSDVALVQIPKQFSVNLLTLYNLTGQILRQEPISAGQEIKLERRNLPPGVYVLELSLDQQTVFKEKVVISR